MPSLFEMLNQNSQGMDMLARQYGLSQTQVRQAVEALLPAFSQGLKQNTADPYGIGSFMTALASGQHAKYFENPAAAFTPQGMAEGNGILGHLFGSKELSRAVADQAAQATGIGQDILKQMLPALATMLMGGMFKQSTNQMQAGGFGGNNPLGEIIDQMMKHGMGGAQPRQAPQSVDPMDNPFGKVIKDMFGGGAHQAPSPQPSSPMDNPLGKMLEGMFGGGAGRQAPSGGQGPLGGNPWGKILEEMMRGGGQAQPQSPEPAQRRAQPEQETTPSGRQKNPYDDFFGDMFETGRKQRDEYQKGMESIFDQFSKGLDKYR
ncbi:MAG: DUF937 domain-containing protein [Rhizobiaceae bacterium]